MEGMESMESVEGMEGMEGMEEWQGREFIFLHFSRVGRRHQQFVSLEKKSDRQKERD